MREREREDLQGGPKGPEGPEGPMARCHLL